MKNTDNLNNSFSTRKGGIMNDRENTTILKGGDRMIDLKKEMKNLMDEIAYRSHEIIDDPEKVDDRLQVNIEVDNLTTEEFAELKEYLSELEEELDECGFEVERFDGEYLDGLGWTEACLIKEVIHENSSFCFDYDGHILSFNIGFSIVNREWNESDFQELSDEEWEEKIKTFREIRWDDDD